MLYISTNSRYNESIHHAKTVQLVFFTLCFRKTLPYQRLAVCHIDQKLSVHNLGPPFLTSSHACSLAQFPTRSRYKVEKFHDINFTKPWRWLNLTSSFSPFLAGEGVSRRCNIFCGLTQNASIVGWLTEQSYAISRYIISIFNALFVFRCSGSVKIENIRRAFGDPAFCATVNQKDRLQDTRVAPAIWQRFSQG